MSKKLIVNNWELILTLFVIFGLVARIFIQFEPLDHFPNADSSVFLYIGRSILNGHLPYRDVWDHKGPLLYYINAFGLWFYGLWGVWILEFVLMLTGLYVAFLCGRKLLGVIPSFVGIIVGYYLLNLFMAGNITEEYSTSFALLTFGLYFLYFQNTLQRFSLFGIGFLFICTFLIRPNNIGFQSAIILSMGIVDVIQKDMRSLREKIYWFGFGMLILLILFLVYFGFNRALGAFYDQAFRYNFIYIQTTKASINFGKFLSSPLNYVFYAVIVSYGFVLFWGKKIIGAIHLLENRFVLLLLIAFPLEFFLSDISGRGFNHYYLTWVPYLVFAAGFSVNRIFHVFPILEKWNKLLFLLAILACFAAWPPADMLRGYAKIGKYFVYDRAYGIEKRHSLIDYIHNNTGPEDKVLRWGFGRWLTYAIDREAPGRFVYQLALTTPGYSTDEMVNEFANDLKNEKPKFIVEAINYFIPLNPNEMPSYEGYFPPGYTDIVKYIRENYHIVRLHYAFDGQLKEDIWIKLWALDSSAENNP